MTLRPCTAGDFRLKAEDGSDEHIARWHCGFWPRPDWRHGRPTLAVVPSAGAKYESHYYLGFTLYIY